MMFVEGRETFTGDVRVRERAPPECAEQSRKEHSAMVRETHEGELSGENEEEEEEEEEEGIWFVELTVRLIAPPVPPWLTEHPMNDVFVMERVQSASEHSSETKTGSTFALSIVPAPVSRERFVKLELDIMRLLMEFGADVSVTIGEERMSEKEDDDRVFDSSSGLTFTDVSRSRPHSTVNKLTFCGSFVDGNLISNVMNENVTTTSFVLPLTMKSLPSCVERGETDLVVPADRGRVCCS